MAIETVFLSEVPIWITTSGAGGSDSNTARTLPHRPAGQVGPGAIPFLASNSPVDGN